MDSDDFANTQLDLFVRYDYQSSRRVPFQQDNVIDLKKARASVLAGTRQLESYGISITDCLTNE